MDQRKDNIKKRKSTWIPALAGTTRPLLCELGGQIIINLRLKGEHVSTPYKQYFKVFKNLLVTDLIIYKKIFAAKFIDYALQVSILNSITAYIMPAFGLIKSYGLFDFAGILAVIGLWEIYPDVAQQLMDLENNAHTSYQLTLPLPTWLVWLKTASFFTLKSIGLTLCMLPIGKIILWDRFDLWLVNPLQLTIIIILGSMFYSALTLWAVSNIKHMGLLGKLWNRYLFPLWILGCFQFSWSVLHNLFPTASYFILINPLTFATEATRAAIIGQPGFLPFWYCIAALLSFTIVLWWHSLRQLKKRLDSL